MRSPDTADPDAFVATFSHHTTTANGVRLHYVMGGKGDPVVLLHGWPQTWHAWRKAMPLLAERHTVIAPDLRGFGDSEKPTSGYDKRTVAEDVRQLVRGLGFGHVYLVGHDIGLMVAHAYATAHPEDVLGLAVMDALLPGTTLWDEMSPGFWHFAFHATPDLPEALVSGKERLYVEHQIRGGLYDQGAVSEADMAEYARCYSAAGGLRGGFEHYRALPLDAEHNRRSAEKAKLAVPVLAVAGEDSLGDAVERTMREVADDVRGVVAERCGHFVAEERPGYLAEILLDFFSANPPERREGPTT